MIKLIHGMMSTMITMSDIDHWFSGTCRYLDMNGISFMFPVWDENGLFVQADSITHEGADDLKSIKENNQKYLRKMFVNREATFETRRFRKNYNVNKVVG